MKTIIARICSRTTRAYDALLTEWLSSIDSLELTGISMGCYSWFCGCLYEPRIKILLPILGSPLRAADDVQSPHCQAQRCSPRAILIQNAAQDVNVPPDHARAFAEFLESFYRDCPERLQYYEFPDSGHFMREGNWKSLRSNALSWLDRFMDSAAF